MILCAHDFLDSTTINLESGVPNSLAVATFHNKQYLFTDTKYSYTEIQSICLSHGYDYGAVLNYMEEYYLLVS